MAKELILKKHFESVAPAHAPTVLNQNDHHVLTIVLRVGKIDQSSNQARELLTEEVMMREVIVSHPSKEQVLLLAHPRNLYLESREEKHLNLVPTGIMIREILKSEKEDHPLVDGKPEEDIRMETMRRSLFKKEKVLHSDQGRNGQPLFVKPNQETLMIKNLLQEDRKAMAIKNLL